MSLSSLGFLPYNFKGAQKIFLRWGLRRMHVLETHIPQDAKRKIEDIFIKFSGSPYDSSQFDILSKKAEKVLKTFLPSHTIKHILDVNTTGKGFIEITGVPEDPYLPLTPSIIGEAEAEKKTFIKEFFCMGLANLMGKKIFNYRQEGWGTAPLIFNVFPREDMSALKGAGGYENDFRFHMENAWHPQGIATLFLTGLRQDYDKAAITYCVANEILVSHLTEEDKKVLQKEEFRIAPPEIHFKMEKEQGILFTAKDDFVGPVLTFDGAGYVNLRINFNGMDSNEANSLAQIVLEKLEHLSISLATSIKLRHDNMVVINNRRAIHTRNGYTPRFNGQDRWFQRYFLTEKEILWPTYQVKLHDFLKFLSYDQALMVYSHLTKAGFLNRQGRLTAKFQPHKPQFSLMLEKDLQRYEMALMKVLIQKGPARPHRVV